MKLLVAGGAGYIGSIVARLLVAAGHQVVVLDDLSTGHRSNVTDFDLVEAPISRAGEVLDRSFDGVVHLAASALVAESMAHPEIYWRNNVAETFALLEAMRAADVRSIVFSSTCAVYGIPDELPLTEESPTRPVNPYGASKLTVDMMLTSYAQAHGLGALSFRYFNVAGALPGMPERHDPETHLIPNLLRGADGQPFTIFGTDFPTRDGTAIRDYLHVIDLAEAHVAALDVLTPGRHDIVNLGTGVGSTVREVLAAVEDITGRTILATEADRRPGDPAELVASYSKAEQLLAWTPTRSLRDAVADAYAASGGA